ncbi:MAG: hypothetical protein G01um101429_1148 [Parcubacteria group bacterium Gr01-1014_29]|nr:MAG: hypothetical protein G01um101429_1148 [Parcubacteria group bacterium Gr01-1014_29]
MKYINVRARYAVAKMKKRRINSMEKPTYKQRAFARAYVKNKGNGTQAAVEAYNPRNRDTAHAIASENLRKPAVMREIERLLPGDEVEARLIHRAFSAKLPDDIRWSELHGYIETSLKLKGLLQNKPGNEAVNVALVIRKD